MDLTEPFNEADVERKRDTNKKKPKTEYELAQSQEIRQTPLESDTEIIGHTCLKRQKKQVERKNEARAWWARTAVITSTWSPTGTVRLDAAAEQCYVGT